MSSTRNLRRVVLGLTAGLGLLGLAGVVAWRRGLDRSSTTTMSTRGIEVMQPEQEREIRFLNETPVRLEPGQVIQGKLKGGEGYRYELTLEEGHFAHVVVEQQGGDVAVLVYRPGQEKGGRVDSPNGSEGPEIVYLLAEQAGSHRLEVVCAEPAAAPGHYEIRLQEVRDAKPEDRAFFEAWRLFRKGESRRQAGNPREALGFYEKALPAWRERGRRDWEAETLHRIGLVQRDVGRLPEALGALQEALPWFREHGSKAQEGEILNLIGRLLFFQGDWEGALRYGEEARSRFQKLGKPGLEAEALFNLGSLWSRRGDTEKALTLLSRSRELARQAGDPWSEALALHGLGEVYLYLGQVEVSLDSLLEALRLEEKAGALDEKAKTLRALADLHLRENDTAAARRRLDEALSFERARGHLDGEAIVLNSLGVLALEDGRADEAKISFESALALTHETGNRYGEAFSLLNLGRALFDVQDVEGALRVHDEAAVLFEELDHRRGLVSTLYGSARALNALGRFAEAERRLEQVGNDTELLRSGSESLGLRSTFFATKQHYFDLYVDVLMSLHEQRPETGFDHLAVEINERRRARSLLEELGGRSPVQAEVHPELTARRRELQEAIEETEVEVQERGGANGTGAAERRLHALFAELDGVRTALRSDVRQGRVSEPRPLSLGGIRELLDPQTVLLIFSLGEERSYLWCVANHGRIESRLLPRRSWIEERVGRLSRLWSRKDRRGRRAEQIQRLAGELSQALLGPVADLLGSRRLVIVADGALQGLSFAALPDPVVLRREGAAPPLLARHEIAYLPSASVLAVLRKDLQSRPLAPRRLVVVADPVFGPGDPRVGKGRPPRIPAVEPDPALSRAAGDLGSDPFRRLPFSEKEAKAISGLLPENQHLVLSGFAADLAAVEKGVLRSYRIVHFATHGLVHPRHPELSGLVLSLVDAEGVAKPGFLRAHRIADLGLSADLVVLSACETGVGRDLRGEGTQTLTRSFMQAGAPRLVVSLWEVNDEGAAELMELFYRGMLQHRLTPSQALRCAQLSMLRDESFSDPFYWAPFVFQGEWEKRLGKAPKHDDPIERQSGGGMIGNIPDDGFPLPGDEPPFKCPDLRPAPGGPRRDS